MRRLRRKNRHCEADSCPPKPAFGRRRMRRSNPYLLCGTMDCFAHARNDGCWLGRDRATLYVVPAKAGTHNHWLQLLRESRRTASLNTQATRRMGPGLHRDDDVFLVIARSTLVRRSPPSGEGGCDEAIHSSLTAFAAPMDCFAHARNDGCWLGRDRATLYVVPAKAGTHNHWLQLLRESRRTASLNTSDTAYGSRPSPGRRCISRHCEEPLRRSNPLFAYCICGTNGLLRGACHRARIRATRWLDAVGCGEIAKSCTIHSPPPTRPCAWWGGVGGGGCFNKLGARMRARICGDTPHPRPLPAASREGGEQSCRRLKIESNFRGRLKSFRHAH